MPSRKPSIMNCLLACAALASVLLLALLAAGMARPGWMRWSRDVTTPEGITYKERIWVQSSRGDLTLWTLRVNVIRGASGQVALDPVLNIVVWVRPWMLAAIAFTCVPAPLLWLRGRRQLRRAKIAGLCANCGYDLRASPAGCPECGAGRAGSA